MLASIEKSDYDLPATDKEISVLDRFAAVSPRFASMIAANPQLAASLPDPNDPIGEPDFESRIKAAVNHVSGFGPRMSVMRQEWAKLLIGIAVRDVFGSITVREAKRLQTKLAEACIEAALNIVLDELNSKFASNSDELNLAVLALGKLGGRGLDYDSDLDLILVYNDAAETGAAVTNAEYYSRAAELFVTALSSMTRDGNLYRVDLRLRPYGSKGMSAISGESFLNYMRETAAVWEMLAFVKLRSVGGDTRLGSGVEDSTRRIIHERALAFDPAVLRAETLRVRQALEQQRARTRRGSDVDIKYGQGGMLDVYFAMRYLQLRDNVPDDAGDRSTAFTLERLGQAGSLTESEYHGLLTGYNFLSDLDHNLRLTVGRTTRLSMGNQLVLSTIAQRIGIASPVVLLEQLTLHRLAIRSAFESVLRSPGS